MTTGLLTEIASYDEPGSWGRASVGWPEFPGDIAEDMYVFANLNRPIPYGSYVRMADCLRVHPSYHGTLAVAFEQAGKPSAGESIAKARSAPVQAPAATPVPAPAPAPEFTMFIGRCAITGPRPDVLHLAKIIGEPESAL